MSAIAQAIAALGGAAGDPSYGSVKLLLHCDGTNGSTTVPDTSGTPATITCNNGAALSTTQQKFGTAALFFDGTNDHVATNRADGLGTAEFTWECWVRATGAQVGRFISIQDVSATNEVVLLRMNADGSLTYIHRNAGGTGTASITTAAGTITQNDTTWYHIAVTRNNSGTPRIDIWLNGVSVGSTTTNVGTNLSTLGTNVYRLGTQATTGEFYKGYLDDIRVTEGVCRYTATFTPPASAFPDHA